MRLAKCQLVVTVSLALIVGLLYSQVCYLDCAFHGCSQRNKVVQSEKSGPCHQEPESSRPEPDGPPDCPAHAELSALNGSRPALGQGLHFTLHAEASPATYRFIIRYSPDELLLKPDDGPFRPPPNHSVLRI